MKPDQTLYHLQVFRYENRKEMGACAAAQAAEAIRSLLKTQDKVRMIFAAAPSQNEFLAALAAQDVNFGRIVAFHMDEYVGLDAANPASFAAYLESHIFGKVPFAQVHYLNGAAEDIGAECRRYGQLLRQAPIDIVCMGIGENGHIAFNDPGEADFHDLHWVKRVTLDEVCRMQQVHDGCFPDLDAVPQYAMTLTVPMLLSAKHHFCMVPGAQKAQAVQRTLYGQIEPACPASALRLCPDMHLYLDKDSAQLL